MEIKKLLEEIKNRSKHTKSKIVVGELSDDVVAFLKERGVAIHTKEIYLNHKGLSHLARESKNKRGAGLSDEEILKIPKIISDEDYVYLETTNKKNNLLYFKQVSDSEKFIKIVINTKYVLKGEKITLILTAGYVYPSNLPKKKDRIK